MTGTGAVGGRFPPPRSRYDRSEPGVDGENSRNDGNRSSPALQTHCRAERITSGQGGDPAVVVDVEGPRGVDANDLSSPVIAHCGCLPALGIMRGHRTRSTVDRRTSRVAGGTSCDFLVLCPLAGCGLRRGTGVHPVDERRVPAPRSDEPRPPGSTVAGALVEGRTHLADQEALQEGGHLFDQIDNHGSTLRPKTTTGE